MKNAREVNILVFTMLVLLTTTSFILKSKKAASQTAPKPAFCGSYIEDICTRQVYVHCRQFNL